MPQLACAKVQPRSPVRRAVRDSLAAPLDEPLDLEALRNGPAGKYLREVEDRQRSDAPVPIPDAPQ
jgi:hypothetical protein